MKLILAMDEVDLAAFRGKRDLAESLKVVGKFLEDPDPRRYGVMKLARLKAAVADLAARSALVLTKGAD